MSRLSRRRSLAALAMAVVLAVTAVACGSDGDASESSDTTIAGGGFAPVSIDHLYGATEIEERPQRIVSLDLQWTDVLTALGEPPVGRREDQMVGTLPWQDGLLDQSTPISAGAAGTALPFEEVAALDPDLIVVTYGLTSEGDYDLLSDIAPTVATLNPNGSVDSWQDIAVAAGEVLGEQEAAAALIADVDGQVAEVASELPGLDGATFAFANYVAGDGIYLLTDPEDGANTVFTQLGMVIPDHLLAIPGAETGRAKLSFEELGMLDAQLLLMLTNGTDPAEIPGYADLPAVQAGTVQIMDYPLAVALNTPTPLSVPYALELVEPVLAEV